MRLTASMLNRKTLCLLLAASGGMSPTSGHAARAEPVVPAAVDGAGIRTAPAFLGSGVQAWDIALPTVEADLAPAGGGVAKTGMVFSLPVPVAAGKIYVGIYTILTDAVVAIVHPRAKARGCQFIRQYDNVEALKPY